MSRNLRKVDLILGALERAGKKKIQYFALDLDYAELVRTLKNLPSYENISCYGLWGSYDDGFRWLNRSEARIDTVMLLSLGSSMGNLSRVDARTFMKRIANSLRPEMGDTFFLGLDHCSDFSKIWKAYHDPNGIRPCSCKTLKETISIDRRR